MTHRRCYYSYPSPGPTSGRPPCSKAHRLRLRLRVGLAALALCLSRDAISSDETNALLPCLLYSLALPPICLQRGGRCPCRPWSLLLTLVRCWIHEIRQLLPRSSYSVVLLPFSLPAVLCAYCLRRSRDNP